MTSSDFGRATEARFVMDAQLHGHIVSRPFAEAAGYDVLLDTGKRIFRVQVKGSTRRHQRMKGGARRRLPQHDFTFKPSRNFDVFAGWLEGEQQWIFLPAARLKHVRHLRVMNGSPVRRHLGDWAIFDRT